MAVEILSSTIVCSKCGMGYGKRAGNFYKCHCQNYKGIGYLTVCKKCTDGLFEKYLQSCADAKLAMRQLCRKLDLYWSEEAYNYVFMRNVTKNLVSAYMVKIGTGSYVGKSYDDTLEAEGTAWTFVDTDERQQEIDAAVSAAVDKAVAEAREEFERAAVENNSTQDDDDDGYADIPEDIIKFWGPGYRPEMYVQLDERYKFWIGELGLDDDTLDAGARALIRQICGLEIDINSERSAGKTPDKLVSALNTLLGSAQLKPNQKATDLSKEDANTPFGVWIRRWEDERPIPEVDPSLRDVDGIIKYIATWFHGHLAKMLGIKKAELKVYEDEVARLRVERPQYNEEDEEEFLNDIFADTPPYLSGGEGDYVEEDAEEE